jgi:prepilin-type N-terminal cleavage/methylation domain-containing protein
MLTRRLLERGRRVRADQGSDAGVTLVELLVSIILLGIVGAISSAAIITATRTQQATTGLVEARTEAARVVERVSRDLRAANPLRVAEATSVTVDTLRGGTCERRRYYVGADARMMLDVSRFASGTACNVVGANPGSVTTSSIADDVTGSNPMFTYFRWNSTTGARVQVASPVAAADLRRVDGVVISVTVPAPGRTPVTVTSQVDLRNVEIS